MKFLPHLGLDIGSDLIKVVELAPENGPLPFKLTLFGSQTLPPLVPADNPQIVISTHIKSLLKDLHSNTKKVAISLPESQVYTRVIEMPYLTEPDLSSAIKWQIEQYIPVSLSDVVLKYQVLSSPPASMPDAKMSVLFIAAPNTLVNNYMAIAERSGLQIVALETETLAIARALVGLEPVPVSSVLVHLGSGITTISVISGKDLAFTQSITTGGTAITRAIASDLKLDPSQAEEYKKTYGLDRTKLDGKIAAAIKPVLEVILTEIRRALAFYGAHSTAEPVRRIVLSGGTALIPEIVPYLTETLGLEALVGDPFAQVVMTDQQKTALAGQLSLFAPAVGLAMKSI